MADILIINGNPNSDGLSARLAAAYENVAKQGATVEVLNLSELDFDPVLHRGYSEIQPLEPDLRLAQQKIMDARHVTWVLPMWWVGLPALMKGFIDRTFLPGWAFSFDGGPMPTKLLKGRSARVIATMDSPRWWYWLGYGLALWRAFNIGTLWFSGFSPVRSTTMYGLQGMSDVVREGLVGRVEAAARQDLRLLAKNGQLLPKSQPAR